MAVTLRNQTSTSLKLEIHFHQQTEASVLLESGTPNEDEPIAKLLLFGLFAARMMCNLGRNSLGFSVAEFLTEANGNFNELELALSNNADAPKLLPYQGTKGRKGFSANLQANNNKVQFKLDQWGFGMFGHGLGYYAPNSVILLLRKLGLDSQDQGFIDNLGKVGSLLGQAFLENELGVINQTDLTVSMVEHVLTDKQQVPSQPMNTETQISQPMLDKFHEAARTIDWDELVSLFTPDVHKLDWDDFDPTVQQAIDVRAKLQAAMVGNLDNSGAVQECGSSIVEGYLIARRLLGTHSQKISLPKLEGNEKVDLLYNFDKTPFGELVPPESTAWEFLERHASYHSPNGELERVLSEDAAFDMTTVCLFTGIFIALAEASYLD